MYSHINTAIDYDCDFTFILTELQLLLVFFLCVILLFLPARRYASAGLCESNVSVCPSNAGIVSKQRQLASRFLHYLIAPRCQISSQNSKGVTPSESVKPGWVGKTRIFLALSGNISKTVRDTSNVTINH